MGKYGQWTELFRVVLRDMSIIHISINVHVYMVYI